MAGSSNAQAAAPSAASQKSLADAWVAGTITSAQAITHSDHPFFVKSTNLEGFKYKYPEAKPTPEGEDDQVWNKTYTAADSRMYNKNGKDANQSRKFRLSGETYKLTLRIHLENKQKYASKQVNPLAPPGGDASTPKAPPKPKASATKASSSGLVDSSSDMRDLAAGMIPMSISEKIKSEGRNRKSSSVAAPSIRDSPGPPATPSMAGPATKAGSPPPPKIEKPAPKKKGTAALVRKPAPKKAKPDANKPSNISTGTPSTKPPSASDSESNDGGEYCVCRGPDDHRMMVFCDGGCEDWYHCSCVSVDEEDAKELLDRFICPKCKTAEKYTTWKRMCRYYNVDKTHRKAARVNDNSKYCSDKCNNDFWAYVASRVRKDDAPSMGGALNTKEVSMIMGSIKTAANFHALGKKPRLPVKEGANPNRPVGLDYVSAEEQAELDSIKKEKGVIQGDIEGIQNQQRLLKMVHERSIVAVNHPSLDVKDICGYDNRLAMNDAEFARWMKTEEGKKAFKTGVLGPRTAETKGIGAIIPYPGQATPAAADVPEALDNICLKGRKKCRHAGWREVHNQDFIFTQSQLRDKLKKLQEKEDEIIDDAETREATKEYYADNVTEQLF
ncbi:hypothetical protein BDZ45DRAFT_669394 [Acephala macrosclerotiorum]|nr:hypothetical protein BDZ45DRAFT_669394 [Acephala macrosclerotiorum]